MGGGGMSESPIVEATLSPGEQVAFVRWLWPQLGRDGVVIEADPPDDRGMRTIRLIQKSRNLSHPGSNLNR